MTDSDRRRDFIRTRLRLAPVPFRPDISLYTAHSGSRLSLFTKTTPYWAYPWAGGAVLARYLADHPTVVAKRRVLDLGAGSGLVGIAASKAGASAVIAAETDPNGVASIALNAAANGVEIDIQSGDLTAGPPPPVDIVLVGDLFYDRDLAERVTAFLDRCRAMGLDVLVGDPGRAHLPLSRLRRLAQYPVPDFGLGPTAETKPSTVFAFETTPFVDSFGLKGP